MAWLNAPIPVFNWVVLYFMGWRYEREKVFGCALIKDSMGVGKKLSAWFRVFVPLKAITSRVRTNPNGELTDMACIVSNGNDIDFVSITVADLLAFRLPVGAVGIMFVFLPKGKKEVRHFRLRLTLLGGQSR